jgi:hypothetical protein
VFCGSYFQQRAGGIVFFNGFRWPQFVSISIVMPNAGMIQYPHYSIHQYELITICFLQEPDTAFCKVFVNLGLNHFTQQEDFFGFSSIVLIDLNGILNTIAKAKMACNKYAQQKSNG